MQGYQRKCAYVATQGPLPNTTYDFWRMVWEMNSCCVIMLTNLVEKSRVQIVCGERLCITYTYTYMGVSVPYSSLLTLCYSGIL